MIISEKKNYERKIYRDLMENSSPNDRRNVESNVKLLNTFLKVSSVNSFQSFEVIFNNSDFGLNSGSLCCLENLFQGQTS